MQKFTREHGKGLKIPFPRKDNEPMREFHPLLILLGLVLQEDDKCLGSKY